MAILEQLGLTVKIIVNGSVVEEYVDEEPDAGDDQVAPQTTTCHRYIESSEYAEFAIEVGLDTSRDGVARAWTSNANNGFIFALDIDGAATLDYLLTRQYQSGVVNGITDWTRHTQQKFRFARLTTHDDPSAEAEMLRDQKAAQNIGRIRVAVRRGVVTGQRIGDARAEDGSQLAKGDAQLNEKALKGRAIHHAVALSPAVPTGHYGPRWLNKTRAVDPVDAPIAVFYFKYRSRQALREEMVIPGPAEGQAEANYRMNVDDLSLEELRRLARERLEEIDKGNVKQEHHDLHGPARALKVVKMDGGLEVVDLTQDGGEGLN